MYLTGAARDSSKDNATTTAGSTIVFDQSPKSREVAPQAWISHPQDNAFMTFPGNLLHGVLPCGVSGSSNSEVVVGNVDNKKDIHRLTFMVGFWTRNVTEGMGERGLYTPCGPMPPANSEHSWVVQSQQGYDGDTERRSKKDENADGIEQLGDDRTFDVLKSVSPAWEQFNNIKAKNPETTTSSGSTLMIPKGLDHRFFVSNAPHCFSESLFQKDDCF